MRRIDIAIEAAKEAGALVREGFYSDEKQIEQKSHKNDLVTYYDKKAQKIIVQHIKRAFPEDEIVREENGLNTVQASSS